MELTPLQRRVLGVLMERSLSQPDYYPMTLNAITAACNQKTNRDPVMAVSDGDVSRTVWELQQVQLVAQAEPGRGARANRFRHMTEERFGWSPRERALMAELLLRGPQTLGELRGRASRMIPLDSVQYVEELLTELAARQPPQVRELPRVPGEKANRFAHTFYPADEALPVPTVVTVAATAAPPIPAPGALPAPPRDALLDLEARLAALESAVDELRRDIAPLRSLLQ